MFEITASQIRLGASPATKQDAIAQVGQLLAESGCIEPGYIASMNKREAVANTYLGKGIAIPHGVPEDRGLVKRTGIAVLQVPGGVPWNAGESARFIVGIAAASDEHIDVLRRLTRVLGDSALVDALSTTSDPNDIIEALTDVRPSAAPAPAPPATTAPDSASFLAVIRDPVGFHARPASMLVDAAQQFRSTITVSYDGGSGDAKSLISLLQLGVPSGATIRVSAQGPDADTALKTLETVLHQAFDAPSSPATQASATLAFTWAPQTASATFSGISASTGLTNGPIRQYDRQVIVVVDRPGDPVEEGTRFDVALQAARGELDTLYEEVKIRLGSDKAAIFRAHAAFLSDAKILQETVALIFQRHSAEWSWQQVIAQRVSDLEKLDDPVLAGRAVDLSDVGQRVLRHLTGATDQPHLALETPAILVAADLTPSDTAALDPATLLGLCTARGGPTSHTAIIARSMGIPAVVSMGDAILGIPEGAYGILDGFNGALYLNPGEADIQAAQRLQAELRQQRDIAHATRFAASQTADGHHVEVAANINRASEASAAVEAGAEGVGLMRTEFLFLERSAVPSEEEQFVAYRDMAQALGGRPLIIRTLDIGGDKAVPYLNLPKEDNSFLGIRGIRLCLARPDLFLPQLRAIYRASSYGAIRIMFPMIATVNELREAKQIAAQVQRECNAAPIPLGIMVEVPSAAMMAEELAQEADFFSIGTNDLTQYVLAMDRLHPQLARHSDALNPAVLRMIARVATAAGQYGKQVGVCGGIASDPLGAQILVGLGVTELSVSIPSIASLKALVRGSTLAEMRELAQRALRCGTVEEVRSL